MKFSVRKMALGAIVAAVYAALTLFLAPISYGPVQFRVSEALCVLPFFFPWSVWGLFIGCLIANLMGGYGALDILFGSLATLIAGLGVMALGRIGQKNILIKLCACLVPVAANGVIVGMVLAATVGEGAFLPSAITFGMQVALGEAGVLFLVGLPLLIWLPRLGAFRRILERYGPQSL